MRPYHPIYLPMVWRGWFDFGTGALGDMGCYSFDTIFRVLKLGAPLSVEASSSPLFPESFPLSSIGHDEEWIEAAKGGKPAGANFETSGPITEAVLLGNVALRTGKRLAWDPASLKVPNVPEAAALIAPPYREGWSL